MMSAMFNSKYKSTQQTHVGRVGAESVQSIVSFVDMRAIALNASVDNWFNAKATKATPEDAAFMASFKKWFTEWQAFRNLFNGFAAFQQDSLRSQVEDYQKSLFLWEARFEQQKRLTPGAPGYEKPKAKEGYFTAKNVVIAGVVYAAGYFVYKYFIRKY